MPQHPQAARPGAAARTRRSAGRAGDPILASKITVPGVADWIVRRRRITRMIAQGTRWFPLTVVTGPPGAGKTMALALWAAAEPGMVAWVSLDEFDNRPGAFWSYVVAALRQSGVAVPKAAAARGRPGDDGLALVLAAVLAAQDPPVRLVLDDLHLLTEPGALKGLDFVLRNAGAGLRLVAAARMDPLLPLHRYRVAGQLAEIRAADLAFSTAEAGLLLARHGITLSAGSVGCLARRTEGWAAGLRLAALSLGTHPDPDQFIRELSAEDSALTGYLVEEVLNTQPPQVRDVLLSTSVLNQVSTEAAIEVTGNKRAGGILMAGARANGFIQPVGSGRYRYHTLFGEILRLKLRSEYPGRVADLHRRAARWYGRTGLLADAVRHAARAGDWPLAAGLVIDDLAISQLIEPRGSPSLAGEFAAMPPGQAWTEPQPHLVTAAVALAAGRPESCAAALDAADGILEGLPADQQDAGRLAAALIRLAACLRTGDLTAATAAADRAELLVSRVPGGELARHPDISALVLCGRGAVELWSGHPDQAARVLESGLAAAAACGGQDEPAAFAGHLALAEALRGRLRRAAELAGRAGPEASGHRPPAQNPGLAALVALAWVHLERYELREARSCLKRAETALRAGPDKLLGAVACLVAARGALAEGRAAVAAQIIIRARSGGPVPAWLDRQLSAVESRACAADGDTPAALAAAGRAGGDDSPGAAVVLAHAWAAAGDVENGRRALAPALAAGNRAPDEVRLHAWLADARLSYACGDRARGRRSLAAALRLAEPEQLRLPFVMERSWIGSALRRDPELAHAHRDLLAPILSQVQLPAPWGAQDQASAVAAEPLTEREREVLQHLSSVLSTSEVASEMHISIHTVKSHVKSIYRKLAANRRSEAVRRARQLRLI